MGNCIQENEKEKEKEKQDEKEKEKNNLVPRPKKLTEDRLVDLIQTYPNTIIILNEEAKVIDSGNCDIGLKAGYRLNTTFMHAIDPSKLNTVVQKESEIARVTLESMPDIHTITILSKTYEVKDIRLDVRDCRGRDN